MARLSQIQSPFLGEVRGLGSMIAIELVSDPATREPGTAQAAVLIKKCLERGLLMLKAGSASNVIRTLMPLVITDEQLDEALGILEQALKEMTA